MAADNNKNDKVRQLYKEDGASKIYPVVIKDSVSDGAGNYGVNAFGTWFRETDMEVKSLSVCEDIKFWEETSTKDSFASVRVKDSSMFINMPLTIGMNNNGYSVKNLTVIAENTSIDSSVLTVKAKKTIVNSSLEITDASINKLIVKDSSFTGESTFNNIVTMKTGLTVYAETDNTAINISTKGMGPHINITGANDCTGEVNVKKMGINLFGSDVAIYSDASNANYTPASITKNGYGKFNTLHIGPMDPENMYSSHLLNDSNWNSNNILKQPSDGSIVFSTTRFGFPGILSEENHIVAINANNKIDVLRLNYPTSKTHSSVLMYDASVANNLTSKLLKVDSNLVLQNNASTDHSQIKAENGLDIYAPNSGIIDIICSTSGRVAIKQGNNTGNDTYVMVVDSSKLYYGITTIPSNASGLKIKASSGIIDSDSSIILRASAEFTVSTKGTSEYSNRLIINSSYSIFNTEVKAKVNGVSDVYLGVPIGSVVTFPHYGNQSMRPAHWVMLSKSIRYLGYTQAKYSNPYIADIPAKKCVYSGDRTDSSNPSKYRRTYTTTDLGSREAYTDKISDDANINIPKSVKSDNMNFERIYWFSGPLNLNFDIAVVYNYYEYVCDKYCRNFLFNFSNVVIDLTDEKMGNSDQYLLDYDNILLNMLEEKMMKVE